VRAHWFAPESVRLLRSTKTRALGLPLCLRERGARAETKERFKQVYEQLKHA
jgi:hypothetical protein